MRGLEPGHEQQPSRRNIEPYQQQVRPVTRKTSCDLPHIAAPHSGATTAFGLQRMVGKDIIDRQQRGRARMPFYPHDIAQDILRQVMPSIKAR